MRIELVVGSSSYLPTYPSPPFLPPSQSGNIVYLLLVVYVFLPIPYKWQAVALAGFLTAGDLALSYYAIGTGHLDTEHRHIVTKVGTGA